MKERLNSIDGVRGIACLGIVALHYKTFFINNGIWFMESFRRFVELFCALSGFMIAYHYADKIKNGDLRFHSFFLKRYLKLMPLYWITEISCILMLKAAEIVSGHAILSVLTEHMTLEYLTLDLLGINGWFHYAKPVNIPLWTVSCLLFCYIVYFVIRKKCQTTSYIGISFAILIFCIFNGLNSHIFSEEMLRVLGSFFCGILLCELYERRKDLGKVVAYACMVVAVAVASYMVFTGKHDLSLLGDGKNIAILYMCPLVIMGALTFRGISSFLSCRVLQFLGRASMDIYMWHHVILYIISSKSLHMSGTLTGLIVLCAGTGIAAFISCKWIEPLIGKAVKRLAEGRGHV